ncbi:MAG: hypothetical protein ABR498_06150 [Candidatus Dormibacteria bacterium]
MDSVLRRRAAELGLLDADVDAWEPLIDDELASALLSALLTFEDALQELTA